MTASAAAAFFINLVLANHLNQASACTGLGNDPFSTGSEEQCCPQLESCLRDWENKGNPSFRCIPCCNEPCVKPTCASFGKDPFATGVELECCYSLERCSKDWNNDGNYYFLCMDSCSGESSDDPTTDWTPPEVPPTAPSKKRGISLKEATEADLQALANVVSWGYTWEKSPSFSSLEDWDRANIEFIPMVWDEVDHLDVNGTIPSKSPALLGFNEPNFVAQANLEPADAAALWPALEKHAQHLDIPILVSPAVNFSPDTWPPVEWMRAFFEECDKLYPTNGCRVDAIGVHSYTCQVNFLHESLSLYEEFNLPMWLTEFACEDDPVRQNAKGQYEYMLESIPFLEQYEFVDKYAWFSYDFGDSEAALIRDGELTPLGVLYKQLEGVPVDKKSSGYVRDSSAWFQVSCMLTLFFGTFVLT
mmetsp:Transcript_23632/g.36496  ORF Transcript_23632/g.36496 Transcript_23632/m.36496 type:complete len:419 (-) Transcript_23632:85-1341(-)|eukprot:CAMPEP_0195291504 /NCGR_PEP_ID=MMETSP0707-20130614/7835_1 /TAXON_ID=33640 /ORGANISM="Asterionellopsis glacialis, Strain CCMP134" /LENGTH=418 /DNA_ID=CAMNT_0040351829 /DNA_START=31 /DNA_END=1287 /DNA_ORIENTATION=-